MYELFLDRHILYIPQLINHALFFVHMIPAKNRMGFFNQRSHLSRSCLYRAAIDTFFPRTAHNLRSKVRSLYTYTQMHRDILSTSFELSELLSTVVNHLRFRACPLKSWFHVCSQVQRCLCLAGHIATDSSAAPPM